MALLKASLLLLMLLLCFKAPAQRYSVLLNEIMADPQPVVSLPEAEYIELKNNSNAPVNIAGWRLQTTAATSGAFPSYILKPDSLVVITSRNHAAQFGSNTIGITSFPALSNSGTTIVLHNAAGLVIHAVAYQPTWYDNAVKAEGGWSLEMIDAANPCSGASNWKASQHTAGGTPGKPNSVQGSNKDNSPPAILAAIAKDSLQLLVQFDEPLDSAFATVASAYSLSPTIPIVAAIPQAPLNQQVLLRLQEPLQPGKIYQLTTHKLADCAGNAVGTQNQVPTGLPQPAAKRDILINEILFNPGSNGADYLELYNRSSKIIDASRLWIDNRGASTTSLSTPQKISAEPLYLFPGQYTVITENRAAVLKSYLVKNEQWLWQVPTLPNMPNDKGTITILNEQGAVLDEVTYHQNWHFALHTQTEGIALERISVEDTTQDKDNWTSAAASAGFGTPTYRNSQHMQNVSAPASLSITPKVFSPDADGHDDFCTITFSGANTGSVANLHIFDAGGRLVRYLVQNQTVGQQATWRWDGLNNNKLPLPTGPYIIYLETFNVQGKKQTVKQAVILARR